MDYDNFGPGEDGYENNDHEYDSDRDVQDSYDGWSPRTKLLRSGIRKRFRTGDVGGKRIRFWLV